MNIIPNNIQAKEFRYRAECRDQLQHKGDLYVGTGTTEEVALDDGTTKNMCKTEPLYRTTDGLAPASDDSNQPTNGMALLIDNSNSKGWKIGQIETAGIKDGAITEVKLSKEYYIKNNSIDFTADRLTGALPHISWSKQSNIAGRPSTLTLQVPLQSAERTTTILNFPVTNSTNTLATKEQIENGDIIAKTAEQLKGWYRHFVTVNLVKGSGPSAASFDVFFELFTRSAGQITDMSKLIAAIRTFGYTALATGAGYVGTGANISDAYHINDNILENRVYNVLRVVYDDHLSTKACCMMIAKTTVSNISSEGYDFNIVAMDKFSDVYVGDAVWPLFS